MGLSFKLGSLFFSVNRYWKGVYLHGDGSTRRFFYAQGRFQTDKMTRPASAPVPGSTSVLRGTEQLPCHHVLALLTSFEYEALAATMMSPTDIELAEKTMAWQYERMIEILEENNRARGIVSNSCADYYEVSHPPLMWKGPNPCRF